MFSVFGLQGYCRHSQHINERVSLEVNMKIKNSIDITAFLENVKKCEGNVYFKTIEGDQLNLKSLLSQYIFVSIIDNAELMDNGVVDCSKEEDVAMLEEFLE